MDIEKLWNKALKQTEIIRSRVKSLQVFKETHVPYVMLCESSVNEGDTVVRKGEIVVEKPSLFVPPHNPRFEGFDFEGEEKFNEDSFINFLLVRGVSLPSFSYDNKTMSLDVYEGRLSAAIKDYQKQMQSQENVSTGLIVGPEDCWQFSLLIFVCAQIARNADTDIRRLLEKHNKENNRE